MQLLLPTSIIKHELAPLIKDFPLAIIKKAALKIKKGLGTKISGAPKDCQYVKIYLTSKTSAGRAVFLVQIIDDHIFPLLVRRKDDPVGKNITPKNSRFKSAIKKNLRRAIDDIKNEDFDSVELQ